MSRLESLPEELLNKILCLVDHQDLRQLDMVSKNIRRASVIAKKQHFDYTTPGVPAFKNSLDLDTSREFADIRRPIAPRRPFRQREFRNNLPNSRTVLFSETDN